MAVKADATAPKVVYENAAPEHWALPRLFRAKNEDYATGGSASKECGKVAASVRTFARQGGREVSDPSG